MSLNAVKDLYFDRMNKGSLLSATEMADYYFHQKGETLASDVLHSFQQWKSTLEEMGLLTELILDCSNNEILVHSDSWLQIEKQGVLHTLTLDPMTEVSLQSLLEILVLKEHQIWNYAEPFKSFKVDLLGHTFRATLLHKSLSPYDRPKLFLRRMRTKELKLQDFALTKEQNDFLKTLIKEKKNLLFCGSTGSGKTSLMSAMLSEIHSEEHVVVLEDTHEIMLEKPNFTYLLSQPEQTNKSLKDYCKYAMRIRPDRMIVGELRGEETIPFLLSMNNGHKGLMSTIHAHSAIEAPMRLALLFSLYSRQNQMNMELVMKLVCSNIDYVIYMEDKKMKEVVHLLGVEGTTPYVEKIY